MHRFTDPTPSSFTGRSRLDLVIASWEIECCAPPPAVGHDSTWALRFSPTGSTGSGIPGLVPERDWEITELPGVGPVVCDGVITAAWIGEAGAPPQPGRHRLGGCLWGTAHAVPEALPCYTGRVQQIQVISRRYIRDEPGPRPIPGTLTLTDVAESPRWFTFDAPPDHDGPNNRFQQTGLLLTMAIELPRRPIRRRRPAR